MLLEALMGNFKPVVVEKYEFENLDKSNVIIFGSFFGEESEAKKKHLQEKLSAKLVAAAPQETRKPCHRFEL